MISKEEKIILKNKIQEEIELLESNIEELQILNKPIVSDCSLGKVARSEALYDQNLHRLNLRNALQKLERLKKRFNNISEENFGQCKICGKDIGLKRLLALPETETCIECANLKGKNA